MKVYVKLALLGLLTLSLFAACDKPEKETPYVPLEPALQEDFTETAFEMNLEMVYVKGGEFMMGFTEDQGVEGLPDSIINKYLRKTKLDSYHIGRYEVTQAQWKAVMGTTIEAHWAEERPGFEFPSSWGRGDDYPMYIVCWDEAQEFCKKLSERTGKRYVLPTSAQWEYAARGGVHKTKTKYAGSNDFNEVAWCRENSKDLGPHEVGRKAANALGLYDMSGNVWEWCSDLGDNGKGYDKTDDYNPQGPTRGLGHVQRGGDWYWYACPVGDFDIEFAGGRMGVSFGYGFRIAQLP